MFDIAVELLRAVVVGAILLILLRGKCSYEIGKLPGWSLILAGFGLIFFGTFIDLTDNFPDLDKFIVVGDTPTQAFLEKVVGYTLGFLLLALGIWQWLPKVLQHQKTIEKDLEIARENVKVLEGLLPICASCKQIRDDKGYWNHIELYISKRSEAEFTHCICPACLKKLYPDDYEQIIAEEERAGVQPLSGTI